MLDYCDIYSATVQTGHKNITLLTYIYIFIIDYQYKAMTYKVHSTKCKLVYHAPAIFLNYY